MSVSVSVSLFLTLLTHTYTRARVNIMFINKKSRYTLARVERIHCIIHCIIWLSNGVIFIENRNNFEMMSEKQRMCSGRPSRISMSKRYTNLIIRVTLDYARFVVIRVL